LLVAPGLASAATCGGQAGRLMVVRMTLNSGVERIRE